MPLRYDTVTLLTDYGTADEFVGVLHSVIRSITPDVHVIDLTHGIGRHDVRAGALALARSAQYLAPGVVVAVVDPGVGTTRRAVAIEVGDGASILVGPDNGLLAPAVALVGGATAAVELTEAAFQLPTPGATFAGRDVFAPAAAHLCRGVALAELGPAVDPASLMPMVIPISREADGEIEASVMWVDTYGNVQLNLGPDDLASRGENLVVRVSGVDHPVVCSATYGDLRGGLGLVVDSYGLVSICLDRGSAAEVLGLRAGDGVLIANGDDEQPAGRSTPVTFRERS